MAQLETLFKIHEVPHIRFSLLRISFFELYKVRDAAWYMVRTHIYMKIEDLNLDFEEVAEVVDLARVKTYQIKKLGSRIIIYFYDKNNKLIGKFDA